MRLDQYIAQEHNLSRDAAIELIKAGNCTINNKVVTKQSTKLGDSDVVQINQSALNPYVSRAGLKLAQALSEFKVDPTNMVCLDVGSSTGGFTDCLLQHGAKSITCVDVGTQQLHPKLRSSSQIELHEQTDIRSFSPKYIKHYDLITIDVAFISCLKVMPALKKFCSANTRIILLYKPQFEGDQQFGNLTIVLAEQDYIIIDSLPTKTKGKKGTQEILVYIKYGGKITDTLAAQNSPDLLAI